MFAVDRNSGAVLWRDAMLDFQVLCGTSGKNVLVASDSIAAINAQAGKIEWEIDLEGERLLDAPVMHDSLLWVATEKRLISVNAAAGEKHGATQWRENDAVGNPVALDGALLGTNELKVRAFHKN